MGDLRPRGDGRKTTSRRLKRSKAQRGGAGAKIQGAGVGGEGWGSGGPREVSSTARAHGLGCCRPAALAAASLLLLLRPVHTHHHGVVALIRLQRHLHTEWEIGGSAGWSRAGWAGARGGPGCIYSRCSFWLEPQQACQSHGRRVMRGSPLKRACPRVGAAGQASRNGQGSSSRPAVQSRQGRCKCGAAEKGSQQASQCGSATAVKEECQQEKYIRQRRSVQQPTAAQKQPMPCGPTSLPASAPAPWV